MSSRLLSVGESDFKPTTDLGKRDGGSGFGGSGETGEITRRCAGAPVGTLFGEVGEISATFRFRAVPSPEQVPRGGRRPDPEMTDLF